MKSRVDEALTDRRNWIRAVVTAAAILWAFVDATRRRAIYGADALLAGKETRPCVLCDGPMERTEGGSWIEWRKCSRCGKSVTGTPWSALVEG